MRNKTFKTLSHGKAWVFHKWLLCHQLLISPRFWLSNCSSWHGVETQYIFPWDSCKQIFHLLQPLLIMCGPKWLRGNWVINKQRFWVSALWSHLLGQLIGNHFQLRCVWGFPGGANGKEPACQCRRLKQVRPLSWDDPGEEHSNPLQYFSLETPMDRGMQQATVYRVTQSWTQLQLLSSSNSKILITHCFRVLFIRECILKAPGELLKLKTPGPSNYNKYPEMCHSLYVLTNSPVILICSRTEEHCPRSWFSSLSCISHLELQKGETKEESKK